MKTEKIYLTIYYEDKSEHVSFTADELRQMPSFYMQNRALKTTMLEIEYAIPETTSLDEVIRLHLKRFKHKVVKWNYMEPLNRLQE